MCSLCPTFENKFSVFAQRLYFLAAIAISIERRQLRFLLSLLIPFKKMPSSILNSASSYSTGLGLRSRYIFSCVYRRVYLFNGDKSMDRSCNTYHVEVFSVYFINSIPPFPIVRSIISLSCVCCMRSSLMLGLVLPKYQMSNNS